MMFEPRRVPARRGLAWVRLALELASRRPWAHLGFGVGYGALLYAIPDEKASLAFVWLACLPVVLMVNVMIARAADKGSSLSADLLTSPRRLGSALVVAFAALTIMTIVLAAAMGLWKGVLTLIGYVPSGEGLLRGVSPARWFDGLNLLRLGGSAGLVWYSVAGTFHLLFVAPLIACSGLGPIEAVVQSWRGVEINPWTNRVWMATSLVAVCIVLPFPMLAAPAVAFYSAILYVGYRDIWLAEAQNDPVVAIRAQQVAADAGTAGR